MSRSVKIGLGIAGVLGVLALSRGGGGQLQQFAGGGRQPGGFFVVPNLANLTGSTEAPAPNFSFGLGDGGLDNTDNTLFGESPSSFPGISTIEKQRQSGKEFLRQNPGAFGGGINPETGVRDIKVEEQVLSKTKGQITREALIRGPFDIARKIEIPNIGKVLTNPFRGLF